MIVKRLSTLLGRSLRLAAAVGLMLSLPSPAVSYAAASDYEAAAAVT